MLCIKTLEYFLSGQEIIEEGRLPSELGSCTYNEPKLNAHWYWRSKRRFRCVMETYLGSSW